MKAKLAKVLGNQPTAVGFGGLGISKNPATWIGTESGAPDCPCDIWSSARGGDKCGDPDNATVWVPKTCDTTLQNGDHWFYTPPATSIRNLGQLVDVYHNTVGRNGVLELDFAINRDGLVAPEHEAMYRAFGAWIRTCYGDGNRVASFGGGGRSTGSGSSPGGVLVPTSGPDDEGFWTYALPDSAFPASGGHPVIDRVVLREEIAKGERVRQFKVQTCVAAGGGDGGSCAFVDTAGGYSVGNRRIALFTGIQGGSALRMRLMVRTAAQDTPPALTAFDVYGKCSTTA